MDQQAKGAVTMSSPEVFYSHNIDNASTSESVSSCAKQILGHEAFRYSQEFLNNRWVQYHGLGRGEEEEFYGSMPEDDPILRCEYERSILASQQRTLHDLWSIEHRLNRTLTGVGVRHTDTPSSAHLPEVHLR